MTADLTATEEAAFEAYLARVKVLTEGGMPEDEAVAQALAEAA